MFKNLYNPSHLRALVFF